MIFFLLGDFFLRQLKGNLTSSCGLAAALARDDMLLCPAVTKCFVIPEGGRKAGPGDAHTVCWGPCLAGSDQLREAATGTGSGRAHWSPRQAAAPFWMAVASTPITSVPSYSRPSVVKGSLSLWLPKEGTGGSPDSPAHGS